MSGNRKNITTHTDHSNSNNNNVSATILKQPPRLDDLAFKALLKNSVINFHSQGDYEVFERYKVKHDILSFLQSIADADPTEVKNFFDDCPELSVIARGTVTTVSGDTYENVSAIELAYVMDDDELMREVLLPAILKLPPDNIKEAETQLANKMAEVEKQRAQFKPYDFSEMVKAIAADQTLRKTGQASEATKEVLENFKRDFTPGVMTQGKSWIKEHLQAAYRIYDENYDPWNSEQLRWYLIHVVGHVQTRVEKCFEQECSQGLNEIVAQKKRNERSVKIMNWLNDIPLTFRGAADSSLLLSRDFLVEIVYGASSVAACGWGAGDTAVARSLKNYVEQKNQQWKLLCRNLAKNCINNIPRTNQR